MKAISLCLTLLIAASIPTTSFGQWVPVSNGLVDSTLHVGDAIIVSLSTDCVNARTVPSLTGSTVLKCESAGTAGTIKAGPSPDVNGSSDIIFWQVNFADGVTGWSAGKSLTKTNLVTLAVNNIAVCGTNLFASTSDAGMFRSTNNGTNWNAVNSGMPRAYLDSTHFEYISRMAVIGTNLFFGTYHGVYLSTNLGANWAQDGLSDSYVPALAASGTNLLAGNVIDDPSYGGVSLSTNMGTNWATVGIGGYAVYSLAVSGVNVFAGTETNGIARSSDNGLTWNYVNNGLPNEDLFVGTLGVAGTNVFADVMRWTEFRGYPEGTFRTTDWGSSWTKFDTLALGSIAVVDNNQCFGTFGGRVFLSANNGLTWTALSNTLPDTTAGPLTVSGNYLFAGTNSGVWRIPLSGALPIQLASFTVSASKEKTVTLTWTTFSETNNYGFYVQRNGIDIAFIAGHGTTLQQHTYTYTDNPSPGQYEYRLKQVDLDGTAAMSEIITTGVNEPQKCSLDQNYPNPFNPSTIIRYGLVAKSHVNLKVYNSLGQEVESLVNEIQEAGSHEVKFDGSRLSSGVYFYRLTAGNFVATKRLTLIR